MNIEQIKETITIVKDYPIKGIVFKDITTLLENPEAFKSTVNIMVDKVKHLDFNRVVGVESRGFFWSGPIAYALSKSFVLARKPGKLPRKAAEKFFSLEYGTNTVHIHEDAIKKGDKVLVVDDLIATGGTAEAAAKLIEISKSKVAGFIFVINLFDLPGNDLLKKKSYFTESLIEFPGH
jgi:adenine phosphoribosyltransferase